MDNSTEENRKRSETSRARGRSDVAAAAARDKIPSSDKTRISAIIERDDQVVLKD